MSSKEQNRWLIVLGGIICQFCVGMLYSWSIFQKPIQDLFGWTTSQVSLTFSISTFMLPIAMIVGGELLEYIGPKKVAFLGGVILCIGLCVASQTKSISMLYIGYGFLGGAGVGLVYGVPIATCVKWFPEKKGMITGLAVAGFGLGSCIYAPVASILIGKIGPLHTLLIQGIITIMGICIGASLLKTAPKGYCPAGWQETRGEQGVSYDYTPKQMLYTWQYWFLLITYMFANATGLLAVGHAAPIGQQVAGLTGMEAASIISILTILNTIGRFAGGTASDRFGSFCVVVCLFLVSAAGMFSLKFMSGYFLYAMDIGIIAFSFGGMVGAFPSIILEFYGGKNYSVNYGLVFLAFGFGGVLGPQIASNVLRLENGDYSFAFVIAGTLCLVGAIMAAFAKNHPVATHKL